MLVQPHVTESSCEITGFLRSIEADYIAAHARSASGAVGRMRAVPQRRVRFLLRFYEQGNFVDFVEGAFPDEAVTSKDGEDSV